MSNIEKIISAHLVAEDCKNALAGQLTAARQDLKDAIAARDQCIADAARGISISAATYRVVEQEVRDAESSLAIFEAAARFGVLNEDRSRVAVFAAQAEDIARRKSELRERHIAAGAALDVAVSLAREAAAKMNAIAVAISANDGEAHQHNGKVEAFAVDSPTLSSCHRSLWPRARTVAEFPVSIGVPVRVELVQSANGFRPQVNGPHDRIVVGTAENLARIAHNISRAKAA